MKSVLGILVLTFLLDASSAVAGRRRSHHRDHGRSGDTHYGGSDLTEMNMMRQIFGGFDGTDLELGDPPVFEPPPFSESLLWDARQRSTPTIQQNTALDFDFFGSGTTRNLWTAYTVAGVNEFGSLRTHQLDYETKWPTLSSNPRGHQGEFQHQGETMRPLLIATRQRQFGPRHIVRLPDGSTPGDNLRTIRDVTSYLSADRDFLFLTRDFTQAEQRQLSRVWAAAMEAEGYTLTGDNEDYLDAMAAFRAVEIPPNAGNDLVVEGEGVPAVPAGTRLEPISQLPGRNPIYAFDLETDDIVTIRRTGPGQYSVYYPQVMATDPYKSIFTAAELASAFHRFWVPTSPK